jgi:hypothetical protein
MAKYRFRGALNAASIPLLSSMQERTVVQAQLDVNLKNPRAFYGTSESAEYNIPQASYMENVLPTAEGLQSVGYQQIIAPLAGVASFDQAITLRDTDENNFILSPAGGLNYIYRASAGTWVSTNPIAAGGKDVSRAYVNGRTFVCYEGLGVYEYDTATSTFNKLALIGLLDVDVRGIGASNNYLIAYTDITVYWSSLVNPVDFAPSILTGAGFSIPQDVKARITAIVSASGGFIIYTYKNAVAAVYTNNIRAPFNFKEIGNAGGVSSYEQITSEASSGPQYAWTTGGFQKITMQSAETVSAEVNDFLAGRKWEYWDASKKLLIEQRLANNEFQVKVSYIGSRYVVLSYSYTNNGLYQYALIFDSALKRWGKLKITHVDCFNYPYPNVFGNLRYLDLSTITYDSLGTTTYSDLATGIISDIPSKRTMAFLGVDGSVTLALLDYNKTTVQQGVVLFGKFQLVRARMCGIQQFDVEGGYSDTGGSGAPLATATLLTSIDGKNVTYANPMQLSYSSSFMQTYRKRVTGLNHTIAYEGTFALSSYLLEVTNEGDR